MDFEKIAERVAAAKAIPAYVKAGEEIQVVASRLEKVLEMMETSNKEVDDLLNELVRIKQSTNENSVRAGLDGLMKNFPRPNFLNSVALKNAVSRAKALAGELKTAVR